MFITILEAAEIARVKPRTIQSWIVKRVIKPIDNKAIGKTLIEREKFINFIMLGYWPT